MVVFSDIKGNWCRNIFFLEYCEYIVYTLDLILRNLRTDSFKHKTS